MAAGAAPGRGPGLPLLHRRAGWVLLAAVTVAHLFAMNELVSDRFGWGSGEKPVARIEVAFVRELAQAAPPKAVSPAAAAVTQRALPTVADTPAQPASAPAPAASTPPATPVVPEAPPPPALAAAPPEPMRPLPDPATPAPSPPRPVETPPTAVGTPSVLPATPSAAASAAPLPVAEAFEWPPSTRLNYTLRGYYRGPAEGSAQVDWLRSGNRYQVHLETSVGLGLMVRRATSDGELTERGLSPRRFNGEQKMAFRSPRRWALQFTPERITLADGREVEALPGVQDEASQFVQLTWLFTTQPNLLQVGRSIDVPLALNRRVDTWTYDVKEEQILQLPFGNVPTFYVKPRREAKGGDLTAEIWFAPTLQYLPVRILIRQDESTFVDLMLKSPPLQAAK